MDLVMDAVSGLPERADEAVLVGRAWCGGADGGPSVVTVVDERIIDLSRSFPTITEVLNADDPAAAVAEAAARGTAIGAVGAIFANSSADRCRPEAPYLLAPADLQPVKACGVTFARSLLERVIEEQAKGAPAAAARLRETLRAEIGGDLAAVRPGSAEAERLKAALTERGLWSQYLEVGIGPYAEVFSKCPPMAAVGTGAEIGLHPDSAWNNPEPEVVLAIGADGRIVGATLGNDVNLRDFEGRSALLLGRAKDNTASCALGPLIRLFDHRFGLDDVAALEVGLRIEGDDGFVLEGASPMGEISRGLDALAAATIGPTHQYPDGVFLFTGTMFVPIADRDAEREGFTHRLGDRVSIHAPALGTLVNRVNTSDRVAPWTFGLGALMRNLAARGLL